MMRLIYVFFHFSNGRQGRSNRKEQDSVAQVRPMYVRNDFFFKNALGAAYNQVRFIVQNLRYMDEKESLVNVGYSTAAGERQ